MPLLKEILPNVKASKVSQEFPVPGLFFNTQSPLVGGIFFAISGTSRDGHLFIDEAIQAGAAVVVVEKPEVFERFPNTILVENSRKALAEAASRFQGSPSGKLRLVGVTGTNGKTTSTFLFKQLWQRMGLKTGLIGTVQNEVGSRVIPASLTTPDPLSLQSFFRAMVEEEVQMAAMEVTSIAIDQERTWATQFEQLLFTNLTVDHLDYHHSMENYFAAKRRLFDEYGAKKSTINIDDSWGQKLVSKNSLTFAVDNQKADLRVGKWRYTDQGMAGEFEYSGERVPFEMQLFGKHNLYNILGVCGVMLQMGFKLSEMIPHLSFITGAPGRLEWVPYKDKSEVAVFVDYAHTPDALENVLKALKPLKSWRKGRLVTVFGCGGDRDRSKRPMMGKIASELSDVTVLTSDNPRTESPERILDEIETGIQKSQTQFFREVDRRKAIQLALRSAEPRDIVLIAGKGHENYQVIGTTKFPFEDRSVVLEWLC